MERLGIAVVYNRYVNRGGEDEVFESEAHLLRSYGHKVVEVIGNTVVPKTVGERVRAACDAIWSVEWRAMFYEAIQRKGLDIVHVHNFFPVMSPSILYAAEEAGVAVVFTLHNYRLLCAKATMYRAERVCDACLNRVVAWPAVLHGCYQESLSKTAVVAAMLAAHRLFHTWERRVDMYIALTEFARRKFIEGGLPAEKIVVKPNFVHPDPGPGDHQGGFALFVGRLSPEKGVRTLVSAWRRLRGIPLKVAGEGPLMEEVEEAIGREGLGDLELLGRRPREEVLQLMQEARVLVFPSECYEGFPMTLAEAFACGLPVVASRRGAMAEIIEDGRTGLLFEPGNAGDLAAKVAWAWRHPRKTAEMGREARREYEQKYTAERNYERLMEIYRAVTA